MEKKEKLLVIVLVCILVLTLGVVVFLKTKKNNNIEYNNSNTNVVNNNTKVPNEPKKNEPKEDKSPINKDEFPVDNVDVLEDDTKVNISEKFGKTKKYEGLEFYNITFSEKDGYANLTADVKNSGKDRKDYSYFRIKFVDKDNNEIGTIPGILAPVNQGEETKLTAKIKGDMNNYINAYDFTIEKE